MTTPTLDQTLAPAQRLSSASRAALIACLAEELRAEADSSAITAERGDPPAVVATVLRAGPWEGDDLD